MKLFLYALLIFGFSNAFAQQADLLMTIGGDVNFTKHLWSPTANGFGQGGNRPIPFADFTRGLLPLIQDADINFANIETVITEVPLLPVEKKFNFQTHPSAIQHLIDIGFNMFSLSNNHAFDYGMTGVEQTLLFYRKFERSRRISFAGIGANLEEALTPHIFTVRGIRIGFLAFGNTGAYPGKSTAGVLSYNNEEHLLVGLRKLREADVDLRVISIHAGTERMTDLDVGQRKKYARLLELGNINLIIGHHPHVVRPIENVNGRLIFYSLGNYLMTGSANITQSGILKDYGLMAKLFFKRNHQTNLVEIRAVQAIPLTNTHAYVRQMAPTEAKVRIEALNQLSVQNLSNHALQFQIQEETGTGQWINSPNSTSVPIGKIF